MRRAVLAILSTITGLVLLLSFKSHSATSLATPPGSVTGSGGAGTSAGSSSTGSSSTGSSSGSSSGQSSEASGSKTVTGDSVDTRWGPVQVSVTVANGKITAVNAVEYPQNNPRDEEINSFAIPTLNQEATSANSANIDTVSGATYTSQGYISSLQSALDKAK
jgi:uncharacterized protein with FMN-binding domain